MVSEELRLRTRKFMVDAIDLCLELGADDLARLVRPQLLRSASGVASNYRAAGRSRSKREFISKLGTVIEEADESELWLDVLEHRKREPSGTIKSLRREATELRAIFGASRRTSIEKARKARKTGTGRRD